MDEEHHDERRAPLDHPARRSVIERLAATGHLSDAAADAALSLMRPPGWGRRWASRALLFFGVSLVLSGVVFFFAFNWDDLGRFAKLGLVQLGFLGCIAAAMVKPAGELVRRVSLVAAGVMVGVFLAVFGQVYQFGADPWELYAVWSVGLVPFALLSRTQGGWVIFATVASVAVGLFTLQTVETESLVIHAFSTGVALVSASVWIGLELYRQRWPETSWSGFVFATSMFAALAAPEIVFFAEREDPLRALQLGLMAFATAVVVRRFARRDGGAGLLAIAALAWFAVVQVHAAMLIFDAWEMDIEGILLLGVEAIASSAALVFAIRKLTDGRTA